METSPQTPWGHPGPLPVGGHQSGEHPRDGDGPKCQLGVLEVTGCQRGGHPEDGDITKSHLGVPQDNEASTWGTSHGWECPQQPPWCPHVPSHAQGDDLGTSRRPWGVCGGCPHGPPGCPCVPHPGRCHGWTSGGCRWLFLSAWCCLLPEGWGGDTRVTTGSPNLRGVVVGGHWDTPPSQVSSRVWGCRDRAVASVGPPHKNPAGDGGDSRDTVCGATGGCGGGHSAGTPQSSCRGK